MITGCLFSCQKEEVNNQLTQPKVTDPKEDEKVEIKVELNPNSPMPTAEELSEKFINPVKEEDIQRATDKLMENATEWKKSEE